MSMQRQRQDDVTVHYAEQKRQISLARMGMTSYQFDGLNVRRNDAQRVLIVRNLNSGYETVLRFTPLEYAVLVPLLDHYERPVAAETLYRAAFAAPCSPRDDRRLYRHIDRMRPKLSPLGMVIRSVVHHGYVLLRVPDGSEA